jgi:hypothetical protein
MSEIGQIFMAQDGAGKESSGPINATEVLLASEVGSRSMDLLRSEQ